MRLAAPIGMAIIEVAVDTKSLTFDIKDVSFGKIESSRNEHETIHTGDNVYAIFGPNFVTLDHIEVPGKNYISMKYENIYSLIFNKEESDD